MSDDEPKVSFVDSNVFVYSLSKDDLAKRAKARELISRLRSTDALRTSAQVLSELFVTLTRKVRERLAPAAAVEHIEQIAAWPVVETDYRLVRDACELSISAKVSYWDALIVCAALRSGATKLYSEDLNDGQKLLGVEIVNPFRG